MGVESRILSGCVRVETRRRRGVARGFSTCLTAEDTVGGWETHGVLGFLVLGTLVRRAVDFGRVEIGAEESRGVCYGGVADGEEIADRKRVELLYWW